MAAPVRRAASTVMWTAPSGQSCRLTPMSGGKGLLEVEVHDDNVAVHSRNCLLNDGEDYVEVAEFEFTLSLHRCQINWSFVESAETTEVERSAYFKPQ